MLCRRKQPERNKTMNQINQRNQIKNMQKISSLQARHVMFTPARHETFPGRVSPCTLQKGSLTVEAAFVIPLFFLAFVVLICLIDLFRVYANVTLSLNESARTLGMYGYAAEEAAGDSPVGIVAGGSCIAYASGRLPKEERVSVSLMGSTYRKHVVDLKAKVIYRFPVSFFGMNKTAFRTRARVHAWTGYRKEEDKTGAGGSQEMVYITDRSSACHYYSNCTHLQISIQCVKREELKRKRNQNGGRYTPCSHCHPEKKDAFYYVTKQGNHYHSKEGCGSLKRTGRLVRKSEIPSLPICSRCRERREELLW